jgi:hypothetical protein
MTKLESAEKVAADIIAAAESGVGSHADELLTADRRAVAKKVLEGLERDLNVCLTGENGYAPLTPVLRPGWKAAADAMRAYRVNPAELDRLMKE